LEEAQKWLSHLQQYSNGDIQTQLLAIQVYSRKSKYLLWLRALIKALSIDSERNPQLHVELMTFVHRVDSATNLPQIVKQVIDLERKDGVLSGLTRDTLATKNDEFLTAHSQTSLSHRIAGGRVLLLLNGKESASKRVTQLLDLKLPTKKQFSVSECLDAQSLLLDLDTDAAQAFKSSCQQLFPLTPAFMASTDVERLTADFAKFSLWGSDEGDVNL